MTRSHHPSRAKATNTSTVLDQVAGAQAAATNLARAAAEAAALVRQDDAFGDALVQMQITREFISDTAHVLGSEATKHGEIAEATEMGIRSARDALYQRPISVSEPPSRNSPIDYRIDSQDVQSKFVNGTNSGLDHVLKHMDKYKEFGRDGNSYYHIPKDQYEQILQVREGNYCELSDRSVRAIQQKIAAIEAESGKQFDQVVKPANSTYAEVQQGKVSETLDRHEEELEKNNEELKDGIRMEHEPSVKEGLQTAAAAGAVAGAFGFAASAGQKYFKEGKNIFKGDFNQEDWKDVGLDTGKAAITGAITGGAVYFITNYIGTSAPLASAFVSTTKGMAVLVKRQHDGELTEGEFADQALLLCSDVAMVTLASAAGQALIPIPVFGALVGSFAGKAACEIIKGMSAKGADAVRRRMKDAQTHLDREYQAKLRQLEDSYLPTISMMEYAFDTENNRALLASSLTLGRMLGVPEATLIKSADEALAFLRNDVMPGQSRRM